MTSIERHGDERLSFRPEYRTRNSHRLNRNIRFRSTADAHSTFVGLVHGNGNARDDVLKEPHDPTGRCQAARAKITSSASV
jgi:hypothetical protein